MATERKILGLFGSGRVALHMEAYWESLGFRVLRWARNMASEGDPYGAVALREAELIGVAVTDSAIESVINRLKEEDSHYSLLPFLHFSGAHQSPQAISLHPLMTFGPELYPDSFYPRIPFVSELSSGEVLELLPDLPNPLYCVSPSEKPYYHSLCVLAGNHTVLLWQKFFAEMQGRYGIPAEDLKPYLERVFLNLIEDPAAALTGPLARGDRDTLLANQMALKGDPFAQVYRAFVKAYQEGHA